MSAFCKLFPRCRQTAVALLRPERTPRVHFNPALRRDISTTAPKKSAVFKVSAVGVGVGALVGTGYSIHHLNKPRGHIVNEQIQIPVIKDVPQIVPSKKVRVAGDQTGLKITLYQYQTCPFCCKVRAFLDYYGISYDVIEVDPVLRQATKWSNYKKVPILLVQTKDGYQPLPDSSMIVSALASYMIDSQSIEDVAKCYPLVHYVDDTGSAKSDVMNKYFLMFNESIKISRTTEEMSEERKWRKWADDVLVHDLSPNVYRTTGEALQAFNWFSEVGEWETHFPAWERYMIVYVGAMAMWMIGKRLKKRHNLKDDVRESLYDHCSDWTKAIKSKGSDFMGGKKPNLADLAVYGVLSSVEGCDAFRELMYQRKDVSRWYKAVKESVVKHEGSEFA